MKKIFVLSMSLLSGLAGLSFAADINVVSREPGSGTRSAFVELTGVEVRSGDTRKDMTTSEAIIASKTDIVISTVETDPLAIGYISMGSLSNRVKAVKVEGISPTNQNVKNGSYKIARPFNIAYKTLSAGGQDFVNFIQSSEGQAVIGKDYISTVADPKKFTSVKPRGKLVVAGSSSVTPVMEKLKERYNVVNPDLNIEIQMSDSSTGIESAVKGTCEIGMASRDLKPAEAEKLTNLVIAIDGIVVIVNNKNKADSFTIAEIKDIFTGKKSKW